MVPLDFVIRRVVLDDSAGGPTLSVADGFGDEPNYLQLHMASPPDSDDMPSARAGEAEPGLRLPIYDFGCWERRIGKRLR